MSDVFISYAHADDEAPLGAAKGWVTTLAGELRKILFRKLGTRDVEVWMDHQLAAHRSHAEILLDQLRASRVLLVVMSPGYEASFWCQRELGNFVARARDLGVTDNVFIIELEPALRRDAWDPSLRFLNPIPFWHREFEDRGPRLLGYPLPDPGERQYWLKLEDLGASIAGYLRRQPDVPTPTRRCVLLAQTTDDLEDERDEVAAFLRQADFDVLTNRYAEDSEAAFVSEFTRDLARADVFAQLLGPREGRRPMGGQASLVALQARTASARAMEDGRLRIVQWRMPGVDPEQVSAATYRTLVSGIRSGRIEEFKREVAQAMERPAALPAPARDPEPAGATDRELQVYVNADQVDRPVADRIGEALVPFGVSTVIAPEPEVEQSPDEIRRAQEEHLETCDGVILVYGRTPETWVQSQFQFARKVVGPRRQGVWGAVIDAAPADRRAPGINSRNLISLNCRSGLDPDMLARFVAALRGGNGTPGHA
jgi:hypothetical protein